MKKFAIACAIFMAGLFSSCADTNFCYCVTVELKINNTKIAQDVYVWTTKNELDAELDLIKEDWAKEFEIQKSDVKITYAMTDDAQADCESQNDF